MAKKKTILQVGICIISQLIISPFLKSNRILIFFRTVKITIILYNIKKECSLLDLKSG